MRDRSLGLDQSVFNSSYWMNASSCEPAQTEEEMLRVAQQLFTPVLVSLLTTTAVTSVAASVVSSLTGAALSSTAAQSGGGAMVLVTQIQFLTVTGKVGGSAGPPALQDFSSSVEWANFRFPISLYGTPARRGEGNASSTTGAGTADDESMDCSWEAIWPSIETLATCVACLLMVSISRATLCLLLRHTFRAATVSESLQWPNWEGPVALSQVLVLLEVAFDEIGSDCIMIGK